MITIYYDDKPTPQTAYKYGYVRGREAAQFADYDPRYDDNHRAAAFDSELTSREYGDFITGFTYAVSDLNLDDADILWEYYESGVTAGIDSIIPDAEPPQHLANAIHHIAQTL